MHTNIDMLVRLTKTLSVLLPIVLSVEVICASEWWAILGNYFLYFLHKEPNMFPWLSCQMRQFLPINIHSRESPWDALLVNTHFPCIDVSFLLLSLLDAPCLFPSILCSFAPGNTSLLRQRCDG